MADVNRIRLWTAPASAARAALRGLLMAAAVTAGVTCQAAEPAALPAASAPAQTQAATATTEELPAATQPADPEAVRVLGLLEAAGEKYKTLRAELVYRLDNPSLGDKETRRGWLAYRGRSEEAPAAFRIHFATRALGDGPAFRAGVDYAFDGAWLTEANEQTHQMTLYQIAPEGKAAEPLRIGKGPFLLPIGQKTADVLEHFTVTASAAGADEPAGTTRLDLKTLAAFRREYNLTAMRLWVDETRSLPVRLQSTDLSGNITTVDLSKIETGADLAKDTFEIPRRLGWTVRREPLTQTPAEPTP
jgi:hypothetical protein